jgi:hypothetical protein
MDCPLPYVPMQGKEDRGGIHKLQFLENLLSLSMLTMRVILGTSGFVPVPDRRRRIILEVVLVRRWVTWVLGIWRGEGLGKGLRKGRSVYKQPETEVNRSCHS